MSHKLEAAFLAHFAASRKTLDDPFRAVTIGGLVVTQEGGAGGDAGDHKSEKGKDKEGSEAGHGGV